MYREFIRKYDTRGPMGLGPWARARGRRGAAHGPTCVVFPYKFPIYSIYIPYTFLIYTLFSSNYKRFTNSRHVGQNMSKFWGNKSLKKYA